MKIPLCTFIKEHFEYARWESLAEIPLCTFIKDCTFIRELRVLGIDYTTAAGMYNCTSLVFMVVTGERPRPFWSIASKVGIGE